MFRVPSASRPTIIQFAHFIPFNCSFPGGRTSFSNCWCSAWSSVVGLQLMKKLEPAYHYIATRREKATLIVCSKWISSLPLFRIWILFRRFLLWLLPRLFRWFRLFAAFLQQVCAFPTASSSLFRRISRHGQNLENWRVRFFALIINLKNATINGRHLTCCKFWIIRVRLPAVLIYPSEYKERTFRSPILVHFQSTKFKITTNTQMPPVATFRGLFRTL